MVGVVVVVTGEGGVGGGGERIKVVSNRVYPRAAADDYNVLFSQLAYNN